MTGHQTLTLSMWVRIPILQHRNYKLGIETNKTLIERLIIED